MSSRKFTKDQQEIIDNIDSDIIVSASAGSGKTTVMLNRVVKIIIERRIPIDRIVIMSFTNAVTQDISSKISALLLKELILLDGDEEKKTFIQDQIDNLNCGSIATIHALCSKYLKEYSARTTISAADGDKLDDVMISQFMNLAIEVVLKEEYEKSNDTFSELLKIFKSTQRFAAALEGILKFTCSLKDPVYFLENTIHQSYDENIENSKLANDFLLYCKDLVDGDFEEVVNLLREVKAQEGENSTLYKVILHVENLCLSIKNAKNIFDIDYNLMNSFPTLPRKDMDLKEDVKAIRDKIKNLVVGDLKSFISPSKDEMRLEIIKAKKHVEYLAQILLKVYDKYQEKKQEDGKIDFNDLEHKMIELLSNEDICEEIAKGIDYICVDEYQDTNEIQQHIIDKISKYAKSIFYIGDLKQSIYRFRFTDPEIFQRKVKEHKENKDNKKLAKRLNKNFRSHEEILSFVNQVFDQTMTEKFGGVDYRKDARLESGLNIKEMEKGSSDVVKVRLFAANGDSSIASAMEGDSIAKEIKNLVKNEMIYVNGEYRKVQYSDIAILFRSRGGQTSNILSAIENNNIPINDQITRDKIDDAIKKLINILVIIDNPTRDLELVDGLLSFFGAFSLDELVKIKACGEKHESFYSMCQKYINNIEDDISQKLSTFFDKVSTWRDDARYMSVEEVLLKIIADTGYDNYILGDGKQGEFNLLQLNAFIFNIAKYDYNRSVAYFVSQIDSVEKLFNVLPEEEGNTVLVSTMHASKGLEYPIVFVANTFAARMNNTNNYILDKDFGLAMKTYYFDKLIQRENVVYSALKAISNYKENEENARLFYVALTRARNRLYVTGNASKENVEFTNKPKLKVFSDILINAFYKNSAFRDKYFEIITFEDNENIKKEQNAIQEEFVVKADERDIKKYLNYDYKYSQEVNMPLKYTVTELNDSEYIKRYQDKNVESDDESAELNQEIGVIYHKVLEHIDYGIGFSEVEDSIKDMIEKGLLTHEDADKISSKNIHRCINNQHIANARLYRHYNELKFKMMVRANEILPTSVDDTIFIQGIADLVVLGRDMGGQNVLIDFKASRAPLDEIKARYAKQVEIYAYALEEAMNIKFDLKMIYVIGANKEIIF